MWRSFRTVEINEFVPSSSLYLLSFNSFLYLSSLDLYQGVISRACMIHDLVTGRFECVGLMIGISDVLYVTDTGSEWHSN